MYGIIVFYTSVLIYAEQCVAPITPLGIIDRLQDAHVSSCGKPINKTKGQSSYHEGVSTVIKLKKIGCFSVSCLVTGVYHQSNMAQLTVVICNASC